MKRLHITFAIKPNEQPSKGQEPIDIELSLIDLAKQTIALKYETLVQRSHIAKLNAFANIVGERLGIPLKNDGELRESADCNTPLTDEDIACELERFATTALPFVKGWKPGIKICDEPEQFPSTSREEPQPPQ